MGRHYNHLKAAPHSRPGNDNTKRGHQKVDREFRGTDDKLAKEYGVSDMTIQRAGKFAAAVETLRTVDPDIEAKVVTGKGPTRKGAGRNRRVPSFRGQISRPPWHPWHPSGASRPTYAAPARYQPDGV